MDKTSGSSYVTEPLGGQDESLGVALDKMDALDAFIGCPRVCHSMADNVLLDFISGIGAGSLAERWEKLRDDSGFWYS